MLLFHFIFTPYPAAHIQVSFPALDAGISFSLLTAPARCSCIKPAPFGLTPHYTGPAPLQLALLLVYIADNTEANVVVGVIGVVPALVAHLADEGAVVPAAAAVVA